MDLVKDDATAIYISAGLFAFLVLLWISTACFSKGPCNDFNQPVRSPLEAHLDPASRPGVLKTKYGVYLHNVKVGWWSAQLCQIVFFDFTKLIFKTLVSSIHLCERQQVY